MKINGLKISMLLALWLVPFLAFSAQAQWHENQYPNSGSARFRWEGVVDGTSYVRVQGRRVDVATQAGLPVQRQRYNFTDPLPRTAVQLELLANDGRGRIRLVEWPRASNNFTAVVRIDDRSGGRDLYSFELRWRDRNWQDTNSGWTGTSPRNADYFVWRGRVDGESIIYIRSDKAREQTINGWGVSGAEYRFSAPLPARAINVNLINTQGRGEVVIIEQPSAYNNYTAAVRIRDRQSSAGSYSFTLAWEKQRYRDVDHGRWNDGPWGR